MKPINSVPFDKEIDATGLNCPMPILHTKKALAVMQVGQVLKLQATDPGAAHDIPAYCRQTGHELVATENREDVMVFYVRRK